MKNSGPEQSSGHKTGGGGGLFTLVICMLLFAVNLMDRQAFSVVMQPMKMDLGLTDAELGMAQTLLMVSTAVLSFPIAYLVDRWSRKKIIGIVALVLSVSSFFTGLARNFISLIIPRTLVGAGEAGFASGGIAMVSAAYAPEKRARMLGILNMGGPIGAAIGMMLGGIISATLGWRWAFFIFAIPGVILGIMAFFMKDYKTQPAANNAGGKQNILKDVGALFKIRSLLLYFLGDAISSFMMVSVLAWSPSLMMRVLNISEAEAGMLVGGWGLLAIVAAPLGGWLADVWQQKTGKGRLHLPALAVILAAVMVIVMTQVLKLGTIGLAIGFIYGFLAAIYMPALNAFTQDVVPATHKGLVVGMATFCAYILGGAWGPSVVGALSDALGGGADGLTAALLCTSIAGFAGGILYWLASRYYPGDMAKAQSESMAAA